MDPGYHRQALLQGELASDGDEDLLLFHNNDPQYPDIGSPAVYYGEGTDAMKSVRDHNFAVHLRHSPVYFCFNVLMVALTAFLVGYVVLSQDHTPRDSLFFALEVIVTVAVVVDLAVEVAYYGVEDYFSIRKSSIESNTNGASMSGSGSRLSGLMKCISHWFQLAVTALCVLALILYASVPDIPATAARLRGGHAVDTDGWRVVSKDETSVESTLTSADEDNLVSLFLLLLRYLVYVIFLVTSSSRSMHIQGCFDEKVDWEVAEASDRESGWWD